VAYFAAAAALRVEEGAEVLRRVRRISPRK
jgi:hypothetical protein